MPSYSCELTGLCGESVKLKIWNDRFIMNCEREKFNETLQRKIIIPYIKEVKNHCLNCPLKDEKIVKIV